jgi:hypothetical protein
MYYSLYCLKFKALGQKSIQDAQNECSRYLEKSAYRTVNIITETQLLTLLDIIHRPVFVFNTTFRTFHSVSVLRYHH